MGKASEGQARSLIASFAVDTPWGEIETDLQPFIELPPKERGERFAAFLRNGARVSLGGLSITPIPFNVKDFMNEGWELVSKDHDPRNDTLKVVDFSKVEFATCLEEDEEKMGGEEKLTRLKNRNQIRLGTSTFLSLWRNYEGRKANSVLEILFRDRGITYLDFFGDVLLPPSRKRCVFYLYRLGVGDGRWRWNYNWLGNDWRSDRISAVLPTI